MDDRLRWISLFQSRNGLFEGSRSSLWWETYSGAWAFIRSSADTVQLRCATRQLQNRIVNPHAAAITDAEFHLVDRLRNGIRQCECDSVCFAQAGFVNRISKM